jgi:hypothetical protein
MRTFEALTDHDFELLVADLLSVEDGVRYEVFARGPDKGIDVRAAGDGGADVIQCKHYQHSTLSSLRTAARAEAAKVAQLSPRPSRYRFVTSRRLTIANKRALKADLRPFIRRQADVWGYDDLDLALSRWPEAERRHIKLWMPSSAQLQALMSSSTFTRSRALAEEISRQIPLWVTPTAFYEAQSLLEQVSVCVVAGVPGIGKTTLARMLLAWSIDEGYEPVAVSADIEEAWGAYDPARPQVVYYDDFLGRTTLTRNA